MQLDGLEWLSMLGNDYDTQVCSIAGALEVVGERWSLLIVRNVFLGLRRFDEIQENLGIARNVLLEYLKKLQNRKEVAWTEFCLDLEQLVEFKDDDDRYGDDPTSEAIHGRSADAPNGMR